VLECLDGTLIIGNACDSTDVPGVLHFAAARTSSTVAGSGLLFTATYNVVSKSPGINVNLMNVVISNGTGTPDSENTLNATFSNFTDFGITASPASLQTPAGVSAMSTITLTSFGGFTDFITFTVTPSAGLTASTTDAGLLLNPDSTASTTLTVSAPVSGSYSVDVTGTGSNPAFTHTVTVPVLVAPPDFTISASPNTLNIPPATSGTSTISVGIISGFSGTVMLSASSPLGTSFSPSSVAAPGTSTLTISVASGTAPGPYSVTVTGVSGTSSHSTTIMVTVGVPDFSFVAVPGQIVALRSPPFSTAPAKLSFGSINNFAGTISVTASISFAFVSTPGSASLPFVLSSSVTLTGGGTVFDDFVATIPKTTAGTGLYVVSLTATSGGITHTAEIDLWVIDYTLTPQDTVVTMPDVAGTFGSDPVTIGAIGTPFNATGFNINPGFTAGTAQFPTVYYTTSNTGPRFNATTTGLDTSFTSRRCFLEVFDSNGNLIKPVFSNGRVVSFAGPLVHLNGDQFGFPPNANGCRLDSFFYVDPLNGNAFTNFFPGGTDTDNIIVEPLLTTPLGTYTAHVCFQAGNDFNCLDITINMVKAPVAPALSQFTGRTASVSIAKGSVTTLKVGVTNLDTTQTVFVTVTITAVSLDGTIAISGTSGVVAIPAGGKVNDIPITLDFTGVAAGTAFNENLVINFGVVAHYTTVPSTQTIGTSLKLTGSLIVVP
jgi:hypothetical protein